MEKKVSKEDRKLIPKIMTHDKNSPVPGGTFLDKDILDALPDFPEENE